MDKEKVAGATRMVVEIDGRWDPKTLYTRIKSAGLPIQGVKPVDYGRCALSFDSWLTDEAVGMIQQNILPFFAKEPSLQISQSENWIPKQQAPKQKQGGKKTPYIQRRR